MSRRGTAAVMMPYGFPRVSGDEPAATKDSNGVRLFSPRERG